MRSFEVEGKSDPFNQFGHGIKSYFGLLQTLIDVFFVLTINYIPILIMNSDGGALKRDSGYALK